MTNDLQIPLDADFRQEKIDELQQNVSRLIHENELLSEECTRLKGVCKDLLEKIDICANTLQGVAGKTYIFRGDN